jgi:hypothetical protein
MIPLSNKQKALLSIAIKAAYEVAQRHHATDDLSLEEWRHEQVQKVTGCAGLSKAQQKHYRALKNHFETLAGKPVNFVQAVLAGKPTKASPEADTYEARQIQIKLIWDNLLDHGLRMQKLGRVTECITAAYVEKLAQAKYKIDHTQYHRLTLTQLKQLLFTVRNRIASKEKGKSASRNKKQTLTK